MSLKNYSPNMTLVYLDVHALGKALLVCFFAMVVWPGESYAEHKLLSWLLAFFGVACYFIGVKKVCCKREGVCGT